MLYTDLAPALLNGHAVRRSSWAPGVRVIMEGSTAFMMRPTADDKLRTMLSLHLLTPAGSSKYESHSIDRRADDWEMADGEAERA